MNSKNPSQDLAHIRGLMDRSTRFISLSGLSGVVAGIAALGGGALARFHINEALSPEADPLTYDGPGSAMPLDDLRSILIMDAMLVLVIALVGAFWFTSRRSRRTGQHLWDASAQRLMIQMLVPLGAGGLFCLALFHYGLPGLVAPATLIFYGLALFNAGKFTLDEVRWLGLCELALGLVSLLWLEAGLLFWAIGFGVMHILYGGGMYIRYERDNHRP